MYYLLTLYYEKDGRGTRVRSLHKSLDSANQYKSITNIDWYENLICTYTKDELKNILTYNEYISYFGIEFKASKLT